MITNFANKETINKNKFSITKNKIHYENNQR